MIRWKAILPFSIVSQCLGPLYVASFPSTSWQIPVRNKPGRGHKHKISRTLERKTVRVVCKKPQTCAKTIVADLASSGVDVSRNTVVRALHYGGLQGHRPRRTPLLGKQLMTARLRFACEHLKCKDEFWKTVLCSDETKQEFFGHVDVPYVCRRKGEAFNPKKTVPTVKHGYGSIRHRKPWHHEKIKQCWNFEGLYAKSCL